MRSLPLKQCGGHVMVGCGLVDFLDPITGFPSVQMFFVVE
jgi:hypothetical protein